MNNDYELIYLAQENNEDARNILHQKYRSFINKEVDKIYQKYKFITTDIDDLKLECKITLDKAINNYNQDREAKFSSYIRLCVETKLKDIIRMNLTKKRKIESSIISLDEEIKGTKRLDFLYNSYNPIEDNYFDISEFIKKTNTYLSNNEKEVLILLIKGKTQEEIAILLNSKVKNIRNTIYRIKTKLKKQLY